MKMTRILPPLALTVFSAAAVAGPSGYAPPPVPDKVYGAGTTVVRLGASYLHPRADEVTFAERFFVEGDAFRATVDPDGEWGWNISGMWMPIDHWGFELSFVYGNEHEGGDSRGFFDIGGSEIGEFESRKSQAFVNWFPLDPSCMFQPYIGVGLNYTDFHDETFTLFDDLDDGDFDDDTVLDGRMHMGHSWGFAWQIGADLVFGQDSAWLVNAAAIYVDSETDMGFDIYADDTGSTTTDDLVASYSGNYRYNPWTFNLSVGYKFSF